MKYPHLLPKYTKVFMGEIRYLEIALKYITGGGRRGKGRGEVR